MENTCCPNCNKELTFEDNFYGGIIFTSSYTILGEIYKCYDCNKDYHNFYYKTLDYKLFEGLPY